MLLVVEPAAFVLGAVFVLEEAVAAGDVVHPLAFVPVARCVLERAAAFGFVVCPKTCVFSAVGPGLDSVTFALGRFELA